MEIIDTKLKKWGNSFGIVVPMDVINKNKLRENSDVRITIQTKKINTVGDLMNIGRERGLDRRLKKVDVRRALREIDEVFSSD